MASKIRFAAPVVRSILATLEANLPTQIATFNAETENAVGLASPTAYVFGAQFPLGVTGFPVVEAAMIEGTTGVFTLNREAWDHNPVANVVVWHEADPQGFAETYEASLGFIRCIIETLTPDGAIDPEVEIAQEGGIRWLIDPRVVATDTENRPTLFHMPAFVQFRLEAVERLETA